MRPRVFSSPAPQLASVLAALAAAVLLLFFATRAGAQPRQCPTIGTFPDVIFVEDLPGSSPANANCFGQRCYKSLDLGPYAQKSDPACDPVVEGCDVEVRVPFENPGNEQFGVAGNVLVYWFEGGTPPASCNPEIDVDCDQIANCGVIGLDGSLDVDFAETILVIPGLTCAEPSGPVAGTYAVSIFTCQSDAACPKRLDIPSLQALPPVLAEALGCRQPRMDACTEGGESCRRCPRHGTSAGGGGPSVGSGGDPSLGPGARLRYAAGGVGALGAPGSDRVKQELGRYFMHDYSERVVVAPDASHVFLLTRFATYREFRDEDADGAYERVAPSDEYRKLTDTGAGWKLSGLDGTVDEFDAAGLWLSTSDRNGNAKTASYIAGRLASVSFPDGRSETFAYDDAPVTGTGKLKSITEVGVGGTETRVWAYTWSGQDLTRVARPDGRKIDFFYTDSRHSGYLTRMELVSTTDTRRVLHAWEYDDFGNVTRAWSGDASATGPNAVEVWSFAYDDPTLPTETTVTDPLGQVAVYTLGRDTVSSKPKVLSLSGDCPACSLGPNTELIYDLAHPLRVAAEIDGEGHRTEFTYDAHGQVISRTEAAGVPALARTTSFAYDPDFPAFPASIEQPSTSGVGFRETTNTYDAATGNLLTRTESGAEATYPGVSFVLSTMTTYNAAGQPLTIDPPGHGTADVTSFTYDATRGDLLPLTRTEPLVGTTTYSYTAFNQVSSLSRENHPSPEVEVTTYDAMNRPIEIRRLGDLPADDLVTEHFYNVFGDLFCTVLPRGNAIQYLYDPAGRLIEERRGTPVSIPSATSCLSSSQPRERLVFSYDAAGNRVNEKRERSLGTSTWATEAETSFVYSSRCLLDKVVMAPGRPEEAVTEHAYDCNGRLERTWDANHPSAGQTNPATRVFAYDALNRQTSIIEPWGGAGGGSMMTSYGYDVQDHLTSVTDGEGSTTAYVYSDRDRMTSEVSPVSGTTSHGYNDHGELASTTDARGVTVLRALDAFDRLTFVDYPEDDLDTTYTYDDPLVAFSQGRLTRISREPADVDYTYDRFGRVLQDGALTRTYDPNGNPLTVVYPGFVTATYAYDFADRPRTLSAQRPGFSNRNLVTGATYKPFGPLASLTLANGQTETRSFDFAYRPSGVLLAGGSPRLDWDYTTDKEGNVLAVADVLTPSASRSFTYQDVQYFLTGGTGPWGSLAWSYDRIGNRLTETRDSTTDVYAYTPNAGGGNTARLSQVALGASGTRSYQYTPAGHVEEVVSGGNTVAFGNDAAGQLALLNRPAAETSTELAYDGRGFLRLATETIPNPDAEAGSASAPVGASAGLFEPRGTPGTPIFADGFEGGDVCEWSSFVGIPDPGCPPDFLTSTVTATYSSAGILYALERDAAPTARHVFYFGGRPVALRDLTGTTETWRWVTTDHLGTPIATTGTTGALQWSGGFESFGRDFTTPSAQGSGVFLRLPGQWLDEAWEEASLGAEVYYNVHRWYEHGTGRYARVDPLGLDAFRRFKFSGLSPNRLFAYADNDPIGRLDPLGLKVELCRRPADLPVLGALRLPHKWLKTDTMSGGMGRAGGEIPGHGRCDCPGIRTEVVDHSTETGPKVTCREMQYIDEDCVNEQIRPGRSTGRWIPAVNDCWSFVDLVIERCRTDRPFNPATPGYRQSPL